MHSIHIHRQLFVGSSRYSTNAHCTLCGLVIDVMRTMANINNTNINSMPCHSRTHHLHINWKLRFFQTWNIVISPSMHSSILSMLAFKPALNPTPLHQSKTVISEFTSRNSTWFYALKFVRSVSSILDWNIYLCNARDPYRNLECSFSIFSSKNWNTIVQWWW